jgi:hypothetical protein
MNNYSIMCVSMKIDNMLQVDRSGVQQCSLLGPCEGLSFSFWDITSGQEPHKSGPASVKRSSAHTPHSNPKLLDN